ncbi:MAG TPA: GNAT family N-acetyltransferase [Ohtaekwangia sp.]
MNSSASHSSEDEPLFFFHQRDFVFRNPESKIISFTYQQLIIYFTHSDRELISLERSSFGGPVISGKAELADLISLLKKVYDWSVVNGISTIQIRCFPEAYNQKQSDLINKAFSLSGYEVLYTDVDQILRVNDEGMNMRPSPKLRVRKSRKTGFQFASLDHSTLDRVYHLTADTRLRKKYPMTMSNADLVEMFKDFPDNYFLYGVRHHHKIIAAAVVIKISPTIWYCFYWGDDLHYRTHSPITFLIHQLYDYAKMQGVTLLDLGTSADKGIVNAGVFSFKRSLGCEVTPRHTFIKRM